MERVVGHPLNSKGLHVLRALLAEWGITSVQTLKPEERQRLAAGLSGAVSALISGKSPPPPGLQPAGP